MGADETFEALWAQATQAGLTAGAPADQTLRPHPEDRPTGRATLPHLTIGEPGGDPADVGPDLALIAPLGEGGMGVVWLARQASLGREVAIKQVRSGAPPRATELLLREGRFMGALEHPNIVPVHALGVDDRGVPSLVMKRVEGAPWRDLLRDPDHPWWAAEGVSGAERVARSVEILQAVCRGVHFAHSRGVLHRDLKPDNVMVGRHGEVVVLDWGIATRLDAPDRTAVVGTPAYMAPEMLDRSAPQTVATDVFLLGACLHEAITGEPRHHGRDLHEVMASAFACAPCTYGPTVPRELAAIAQRACARAPEDRFASAAELERALASYLRHRAAAALSAAAQTRLAELDAILAAQALSDADRVRVQERLTECRFGFRQALELWPDDPTAAAGLRRALSHVADHEARVGNGEALAALISELDALGEPTAAPREALARLRADRERIAAIARDQDLSVGSSLRTMSMVFSSLVFAVTAAVVLTWVAYHPGAYDQKTAFFLGIATGALIVGGMFVFRRRLLANRVNQQLTVILLTLLVGLCVTRGFAWRFGTPIPAMLASDSVMFIMAGTVAGAASYWRLVWAGIPYALALPFFAFWPEHSVFTFGIAGTAASIWAAVVVWQHGLEVQTGKVARNQGVSS